MNKYDLKLEAPWPEVKAQLQEVNTGLTDEDLSYENGREDELLERLSYKLNKSVPEVKGAVISCFCAAPALHLLRFPLA